jgi:hypothetical protein
MGGLRVSVRLLAVLVGACGVLFGLVVLAHRVMVYCLMMVMSRCGVARRRLVMVLNGGMLILGGH